jgi:hypothetical protein
MAEVTLFWTGLGLAWLLALLPFLALRRLVDRVHWRVWVQVLHGHAADCLAALRLVCRANALAVAEGVDLAQAHHERGHGVVARERLLSVLRAAQHFAARTRGRLLEWHLACRAALQLAPLPPLRARRFHLGGLRGLARLHFLAHLVPATEGERFRLRLRVLDRAHRWLAGGAARAARRLAERPEAIEVPATWRQARSVAHDFDALTDETLASAEALLRSAQTFARETSRRGDRHA